MSEPSLYDVLLKGLDDSERVDMDAAIERARLEQLAEAASAEPPRVRRRTRRRSADASSRAS